MTKEIALRLLQFLDNTPLTGKDMPDFGVCVNALRVIAQLQPPPLEAPKNEGESGG